MLIPYLAWEENIMGKEENAGYLLIALTTPSFSTRSLVSRSPAVSLSNTGYPSILTGVCITSLVVPAISVTMAAGLWPAIETFLTLSQTTNFRLFQIERVCKDNFKFDIFIFAENSPDRYKTLWEKEKLLVSSNFSFSHSVFKRLVVQTRKNQGLFGKGFTTQLPLLSILWKKCFSKHLGTRCVAETQIQLQWPFFKNCDHDIWPRPWQMTLTLIPNIRA